MDWIPKGWGGEKVIVNKPQYCGKILVVMQGKRGSLHYHKLKDETFYILKGKVVIEHESIDVANDPYKPLKQTYLYPGNTMHIPPMLAHRIIALEDSEILEISTEHFDSDSYRIIPGN